MLLFLVACEAEPTDSQKTGETGDSTVDTTDTVVDTAETGETADTSTTGETDTAVETGETGDTETGETGETGDTDTGPPDIDDGGPATPADCTSDWSEPSDAGEVLGTATYDSDGNKVSEDVTWPDGTVETYAWTYDSTTFCVTEYAYSSTNAEGATISQVVTYTCNTDGLQTGAVVESHAPSDSGIVADIFSIRYENLVSGTGQLLETKVYWIEDEVETLHEILEYFYDTTTLLLSRDTEDTDADGTADNAHNWSYDDKDRLSTYRTDEGIDAVFESMDRYAYYGESTREYQRETSDPSTSEIKTLRTWTWTCP